MLTMALLLNIKLEYEVGKRQEEHQLTGLQRGGRAGDIYLDTCKKFCWEGSSSRVLVLSAIYLLTLLEIKSHKRTSHTKEASPKNLVSCLHVNGKVEFCGNLPKSSSFRELKMCLCVDERPNHRATLLKNIHRSVTRPQTLCVCAMLCTQWSTGASD